MYTNKHNKKKQPVARKTARSQSGGVEVHTQPVGVKTKPKYDKKEN